MEAAIFLGNLRHEYGGYLDDMVENCYRARRVATDCPAYDDATCRQGGNPYFGRGPIQLSHCFNYKPMGQKLGFDLVRNPGLVADPQRDISWRTAMTFWKDPDFNCGPCASAAAKGNVAEVTRRINSIECGATPQQTARIQNIQFVQKSCFGLPPVDANAARC